MDQENEEFCRLRSTGIAANDVNIVGIFIKALTGTERKFFSAFDLHYDRALQHIDRHLRVMAVNGTRKTWRKVDGVHQNFAAGGSR